LDKQSFTFVFFQKCIAINYDLFNVSVKFFSCSTKVFKDFHKGFREHSIATNSQHIHLLLHWIQRRNLITQQFLQAPYVSVDPELV